jgi:GH15 family glucan-1,4-alpha-glucosidase
MASKIEDYALIGDCEAAALVGRDGSLDWLCWPRFDSGACFAALLGTPEHGRWLLAPGEECVRVSRRYRRGTLILETCFETASGTVIVTDFMPPRSGNSDVVRIVRGAHGTVPMRMELVIRFDYGASVPWVRRLDDGRLSAVAGPDMLVLSAPGIALRGEGYTTVADFNVRAGETLTLDLTHAASYGSLPRSIDPLQALATTEAFWHDWLGRQSYRGEHAEAVERSLLTLKALTYRHTGGIVAAPTTSLPEQCGGVRNWDYRYCWIRDSAFTLLALLDCGFIEEARDWRAWLLRAAAGSPAQMQIMYGLAGERRLPEMELPWLPGYEDARPVRIGNAAAAQHQLDIYGELMDALFQARRLGMSPMAEGWALAQAIVARVEQAWRKPDEGIWEVRSEPQHFTHSKVMAWVAVDRAIRAAELWQLPCPLERWRTLRGEIRADVERHGYDSERGTFVRSYGQTHLDASLLLLPIVGFLPATDPRMRRTTEAIRRELGRDGLVLRYDTARARDGLPPGEGVFLACSFWLADNLIMQGREPEAVELFERLLSLRNDVGLLAEMYDPAGRRQLGNFPQAFSHVALVNTALHLSRSEVSPTEQRADATDAGTSSQ